MKRGVFRHPHCHDFLAWQKNGGCTGFSVALPATPVADRFPGRIPSPGCRGAPICAPWCWGRRAGRIRGHAQLPERVGGRGEASVLRPVAAGGRASASCRVVGLAWQGRTWTPSACSVAFSRSADPVFIWLPASFLLPRPRRKTGEKTGTAIHFSSPKNGGGTGFPDLTGDCPGFPEKNDVSEIALFKSDR